MTFDDVLRNSKKSQCFTSDQIIKLQQRVSTLDMLRYEWIEKACDGDQRIGTASGVGQKPLLYAVNDAQIA